MAKQLPIEIPTAPPPLWLFPEQNAMDMFWGRVARNKAEREAKKMAVTFEQQEKKEEANKMVVTFEQQLIKEIEKRKKEGLKTKLKIKRRYKLWVEYTT